MKDLKTFTFKALCQNLPDLENRICLSLCHLEVKVTFEVNNLAPEVSCISYTFVLEHDLSTPHGFPDWFIIRSLFNTLTVTKIVLHNSHRWWFASLDSWWFTDIISVHKPFTNRWRDLLRGLHKLLIFLDAFGKLLLSHNASFDLWLPEIHNRHPCLFLRLGLLRLSWLGR